MTEVQTVINRNTGFYWSISIELECKQDPNNPVAAGNKIVTKYQLTGNEDTWQLAYSMLLSAREYIHKLHKESMS